MFPITCELNKFKNKCQLLLTNSPFIPFQENDRLLRTRMWWAKKRSGAKHAKEKNIAHARLDASSLSPHWAFSFPHCAPNTFSFLRLFLLSSIWWLSQRAEEHLPTCFAPPWFVSDLSLQNNSNNHLPIAWIVTASSLGCSRDMACPNTTPHATLQLIHTHSVPSCCLCKELMQYQMVTTQVNAS